MICLREERNHVDSTDDWQRYLLEQNLSPDYPQEYPRPNVWNAADVIYVGLIVYVRQGAKVKAIDVLATMSGEVENVG